MTLLWGTQTFGKEFRRSPCASPRPQGQSYPRVCWQQRWQCPINAIRFLHQRAHSGETTDDTAADEGQVRGSSFCQNFRVGQLPLLWRWKGLGRFLSPLWLRDILTELPLALKPAHHTEEVKPPPLHHSHFSHSSCDPCSATPVSPRDSEPSLAVSTGRSYQTWAPCPALLRARCEASGRPVGLSTSPFIVVSSLVCVLWARGWKWLPLEQKVPRG